MKHRTKIFNAREPEPGHDARSRASNGTKLVTGWNEAEEKLLWDLMHDVRRRGIKYKGKPVRTYVALICWAFRVAQIHLERVDAIGRARSDKVARITAERRRRD